MAIHIYQTYLTIPLQGVHFIECKLYPRTVFKSEKTKNPKSSGARVKCFSSDFEGRS